MQQRLVEQYANNPIESDHGRLKSRLRPMRGLTQLSSARVISAGHAFIQNLRRGHYELGAEDIINRHQSTGPGCVRRAGPINLTDQPKLTISRVPTSHNATAPWTPAAGGR